MMLVWIVLALVAGLTLGLAVYAGIVQPRRIAERRRDALRVFSTAIELRFPGHVGTTRRVLALGDAVATDLGLSAEERERIDLASRLRHIGLCAVPWKLINEKSPLTWSKPEAATYDRHAEVGAAMLELIPTLKELAPVVRNYRAPVDGSAGPTFPSRENLPIESRILGAVDAYVNGERFQGAILAREHLKEQAGRYYDARVVEALLRVLPSVSVHPSEDFRADRSADLSDRAGITVDGDRVGPPERGT